MSYPPPIEGETAERLYKQADRLYVGSVVIVVLIAVLTWIGAVWVPWLDSPEVIEGRAKIITLSCTFLVGVLITARYVFHKPPKS